jgi:hypothetical protein
MLDRLHMNYVILYIDNIIVKSLKDPYNLEIITTSV